MPIWTRSANRLVLAGWVLIAAASPPTGSTDPAADARERLARALDQQCGVNVTVPAVPAVAPQAAVRSRIANAARHAGADTAARARAQADLGAAHAAIDVEAAAMAARLHQAVGLAAPSVEAVAKAAAPGAIRYVPMIFVSSSMPIDELRTYASGIERTGGALAFRGMPGGLHRVAPMAKLSAEILRLDPGCEGPSCAMRNVAIVVDPIAFRAHGVTSVPALAMVPGDPTTPYCERTDIGPGPDILVTGDAALSGLLEEYARLGGKMEVADAQARLGSR